MEVLAGIAFYFTFPELARGRDNIHFIDNYGAITALLNGAARSPDTNRLVHIFHMFNSGLNNHIYWDWVASHANIADLPSRMDFSLLIKLNAEWGDMILPTAEQFKAPFAYWRSQAEPLQHIQENMALLQKRKRPCGSARAEKKRKQKGGVAVSR